MVVNYDSSLFSKTLYVLINEYNTTIAETFAAIILHFPKSWITNPKVRVDHLRYDFSTEDTIEIEVDWEDPITKQKINYTALRMKDKNEQMGTESSG